MEKDIAVIILAAGKSTRMKSAVPKPLHDLCGRPVISYLLDLVKSLKAKKVVAVLGYRHDDLKKALPAGIITVIQKKLCGTADAVKYAAKALKGFKGTVLVLYADTPLLKKATVDKLIKRHLEDNSDITLLTAKTPKPQGYGRILRDKYFAISGIAEDKDADDFKKTIEEINTGIICFKADKLFHVLGKIKPNNLKREYYLTDAVEIIYKNGGLASSILCENISECMGINARSDLAKAYKIMNARIIDRLMAGGVTVVDPNTTFISYGTKIGKDTLIYPFTVIERGVRIGTRAQVGPFAHLRQGTVIGDDVTAGNFLEIVRSKISEKTFIKHFSYIGDSRIGKSVNIGAGTVVANFDGKNKNNTVIGDRAFIGSDTVLISPVKVGNGAKTAAGSVLLKNTNVPENSIVAGVPARVISKKKHRQK